MAPCLPVVIVTTVLDSHHSHHARARGVQTPAFQESRHSTSKHAALNVEECSLHYALVPSNCTSKGILSSNPSFSHGFFLLDCVLCVPWPSRIVSGISLIPGTGLPDCISSTISWYDNRGGSSSFPVVVRGSTSRSSSCAGPPLASIAAPVGSLAKPAGTFPASLCRRHDLYSSSSIDMPVCLGCVRTISPYSQSHTLSSRNNEHVTSDHQLAQDSDSVPIYSRGLAGIRRLSSMDIARTV